MLENLKEFLAKSYTAFHAVENAKAILQENGFLPLKETEDWEIEENGKTFEENAIIKASVPAKLGYIGVSDDSGLCVEALNWEPGIYSARYSGGDDEDNNDLILEKLKNEANRTAKYVCAIACVFPDHSKDFVVKGECYGKILRERHGDKQSSRLHFL